MGDTRAELKAELEKGATALRMLRDEVRVHVHLGQLDAQDAWRRLEPRLESALERAEKDVSDASRTAVKEVTEAVRKFRESLH
jgi:hypothetical protein